MKNIFILPILLHSLHFSQTIIGSYKSAVTRFVRKDNNPKFAWQSLYYDHVIRNEFALEKIQYYIRLNPENRKHNQNVFDEDKRFMRKLNKLKHTK